jgi:hypothetical protein
LAASYEFSKRLASKLNDQSAYKRNVRVIFYHAGAIQYDADAIATMALAYDEIMKAVGVTGTERPESMTVARLIVEACSTRGGRSRPIVQQCIVQRCTERAERQRSNVKRLKGLPKAASWPPYCPGGGRGGGLRRL